MNVDRLKELADKVEPELAEFPEYGVVMTLNMTTFFKSNKTPGWLIYWNNYNPKVNSCGCLVGYTILMFGDKAVKEDMVNYKKGFSEFDEATYLLELDYSTAKNLFMDSMSAGITGEVAARVIRKLLMTGKVDWSLTWR